MKYRKLRIAFSAPCGIVCLLLIVLWVRSYYKYDDFRGIIGKKVLNIQSVRGELGIGRWAWQFKPFPWSLSSQDIDESDESFERLWPPVKDRRLFSTIGIRWQRFPNDMTLVVLQYWMLAVVAATLSAVPWTSWRFSLRTLLIAVTLVAVLLGAVIYAAK